MITDSLITQAPAARAPRYHKESAGQRIMITDSLIIQVPLLETICCRATADTQAPLFL